MKHLFKYVLLFMSTIVMGQNVIEVHYRRVDSDKIAEFEYKENKYWSKVKQAAINDGNLLATAFFRVADAGIVDDPTMPTHAFVLVFKDFEQLANSKSIWANAGKVLDVDPSTVGTDEISKTLMVQRYKLIDELPLQEFKYAVWNYSKPKDLRGFVDENIKLWKPHFKKNLGKNGYAGWGIFARVYPQGMNESSVLTYDHYTTLASAMNALSPMDYDQTIVSKSKMSEYDPNGFRYRVLLELIEFQGSVD